MASFSVLTRDAPASLSLVRDGFSFSAFIFGPFWFAWTRAWLGFVMWIAGAAAIITISRVMGMGAELIAGAIFTFTLLMALEASEFRRRSLVRRGYRLVDVVEAHSGNEAEVRFLARRYSEAPVGAPGSPAPRLAPYRAEPVGLFFNGT
ncbi:MAG: DUF2628 domain-containing protein [Beijerinckiaceae bacterium]